MDFLEGLVAGGVFVLMAMMLVAWWPRRTDTKERPKCLLLQGNDRYTLEEMEKIAREIIEASLGGG